MRDSVVKCCQLVLIFHPQCEMKMCCWATGRETKENFRREKNVIPEIMNYINIYTHHILTQWKKPWCIYNVCLARIRFHTFIITHTEGCCDHDKRCSFIWEEEEDVNHLGRDWERRDQSTGLGGGTGSLFGSAHSSLLQLERDEGEENCVCSNSIPKRRSSSIKCRWRPSVWTSLNSLSPSSSCRARSSVKGSSS